MNISKTISSTRRLLFRWGMLLGWILILVELITDRKSAKRRLKNKFKPW